MEVSDEIDALAEFESRRAGSDSERRAANHLADRLRDLDRDAEVQPIRVWPRWAAALVLLALLGIVASTLAPAQPAVAAALALLATLGMLLEPTGLPLARRLTGWRASQNVLSREESPKPGVLVLVAHYDTPIGSGTMAERLLQLAERVLRRRPDPILPLVACAIGVLACAGVRILGVESPAVDGIQFAVTVGLIVAIPLLAGIALAPPSPGGNDNDSGVATVMRLAESHGGALEFFDLWILLTGAQGAVAGGMRRFLRTHRKELGRTTTVFLNIDAVGHGGVRYARREGVLIATRQHRQLVELCEEVADGDVEAEPIVLRSPTDASAARGARYPAITVTCGAGHGAADDEVDAGALDSAYDFAAELIERIDVEIGPDLEPDET